MNYDHINLMLNQIVDGPYKDEFYQFYGRKSKLFIHQNFDPNSGNFFYVRQSRDGDDIRSKAWQMSKLSYNNTSNIIVSTNSAYQENKAGYILDVIKYINDAGNKNFIISVSDYSRFSRNLEVTSKIFNYIYDNNITFYLDVDGKIYNYKEEYYSKLREKFRSCENFSKELSREMKLVHKKRKELSNKVKYSQLATNYFKFFISQGHSEFKRNPAIFNSLNRNNLNALRISQYKMQTNDMFVMGKDIFYFFCPIINCRIICPEELAYIEDLDSSIIKGFTKEDFLALANNSNQLFQWICYPYDNFEMTDMELDLPS